MENKELKEEPKKTTWQILMEAPKGGKEYNPKKSFSLHVNWVVRSPKAAKEMIEKGFKPCAQATLRDSPTTLAYFFRIAKDQTLAKKLKDEVKTIGQHPHYQPIFKSLEMGLPRMAMEMKMRLGGIDPTPLSWSPTELLSGHEEELDFDPVVLECTEVYLDDRAFYEHGASPEWQKGFQDINKAVRSLKPTTYCIGNPSDDIWERTLDSFLKSIRITNTDSELSKLLNPGVFFSNQEFKNTKDHSYLLLFELDVKVKSEKLSDFRTNLDHIITTSPEIRYMIVLPFDLENTKDLVEVRLMFSIISPTLNSTTENFQKLMIDCDQNIEGRVFVFDFSKNETSNSVESVQKRNEAAKEFLSASSLTKIEILDGVKSEEENIFSGYGLHPLFGELIQNDQFEYKIPSTNTN
eukprot:c17829_g1_i1.p1 GENE.c17829_g1_i1~~c17829_g1_i1.p1  ORF type:complete len:408 (+),score=90.65 c17829_g1_i1:145-1368(+)